MTLEQFQAIKKGDTLVATARWLSVRFIKRDETSWPLGSGQEGVMSRSPHSEKPGGGLRTVFETRFLVR